MTINCSNRSYNTFHKYAGTYTVTYTIAAANGCAAYNFTTSVTIAQMPSATISYAGTPFCKVSSNCSSGYTVRNTGGTYSSTAGLSLNSATGAITPSTSTAGTYTVTYTVAAASGCAAYSTTTSVTITATPSATISYAGTPYCTSVATAQSVTQTGSSGGTYSSTAGLTINATTGAITPSTSTAGTYTVNYIIAASAGCAAVTATTSVTITQMPSATISYAGTPFCSSIGSGTVSFSGTTGGTFLSTTGLSVNGGSGMVFPQLSSAGNYTVTYSVGAAGGCSAYSTTTSVTISAAPWGTISYSGSPYCKSLSTAQTVTRNGTGGGTYSAPAGLTLDPMTGSITPSLSNAGTYTVTYTVAASGGCADYITTASVSITDVPSASISMPGLRFAGLWLRRNPLTKQELQVALTALLPDLP